MKSESSDPTCDLVTVVSQSGVELKKFERVKIAPAVELGYTLKIDGIRHEVIAADGLRWTVKPIDETKSERHTGSFGALVDGAPVIELTTTPAGAMSVLLD